MARPTKKNGKSGKKVTRYTYDDVKEPRTPETGHTALLPVDMDPSADPVLFWAGKRNKREVPVLPLQRNEIVSESRIAQIIDRARKAAAEKSGEARQGSL